MDKAKIIIAHFLKITPVAIEDDTKMDYTVIPSSLLQHRMYSLLAEKGFIVEDPGSIVTFKDFREMLGRSGAAEVIVKPYSEIDVNLTRISENNTTVGIDIEDISSFPEANNYNDDRFYVDNFSLNEIDYCKSKVNPKNSFAAIFSLKESIIKADNSLKTTPFNELEIKHNIEGRPIYDGFFLSNSHSNGNVVSIAIKNDLHTYHEINNTKINRLLGKFFSKKEVLFVGIFSIIISISISFFLQGR
jgi:phosphopantetheinyl transferase (holo-ACP synthase)